MNKQLLISEFLTTPWALMPERLQAMTAVLTRWSSDVPPSDETLFQINTDRVLRDTRKQLATDRAASNAGMMLPSIVTLKPTAKNIPASQGSK